jgi:hypothetical protein
MGFLHPPLPPAGSLTDLARKDIVVGCDHWLISMCSKNVLELPVLRTTPFYDVGEYKGQKKKKRKGRSYQEAPASSPLLTHIMLLSRLL